MVLVSGLRNMLAGMVVLLISVLARSERIFSLKETYPTVSSLKSQGENEDRRRVQHLTSSDAIRSKILDSLNGSTTETQSSTLLRRSLAIGDFATFNELFNRATILLPDATVSDRILGIGLTLQLTNIRCSNVQVGDIVISYNLDNNQRLTYGLDVIDLDLNCFLDYRYDYGIFGGNGNAVADTDNNDANFGLAFSSLSFDLFPPNSVAVESCVADINVSDLDFDGDWISSILDVMERLIRGTIEGEIQDVVCGELGALADDLMQDFIDLATETLDPYLQPLTIGQTDPLAAERALDVPEDLVLVDFQATEETVGKWFKTILDEADDFLGTSVSDDGGPTGTNRDLGINVFLRENLLDADRAFALDVSDLPFDFDGVLYEGQDRLTETTITLERIKLFGLDTFTQFAPLQDIGKYTLQNELSWQYLTIELDLDVIMKASTKTDSILVGPSDVEVQEKFSIDFGVEDVDAIVSILLAVDQQALGSLQLGPLLDLDSLVSCLLSIVFDLQISGLDVTVGNIREPVLSGFVSPGIDRVVSRTADAFFLMYESSVLKAVPSLFWTTIRDILNNNLNLGDTGCPLLEFGDELIDYRDLFLKPNVAALSGGSGTEPYGSLASTLFALLQDQITVLGEDGLPKINSFVLRPFMESQSGNASLLSFPGTLFGVAQDEVSNGLGSALADSFELALSDTRIWNLDTITAPLSVIQPTTGPHVLKNLVNIGPVFGKPLNATLSLLIALDGEDSPFAMRNELEISASVERAVFIADIIAKIRANPLMRFPLRDVLNLNCWLSLFEAPELDADGFRLNPNSEPGLGLTEFLLTMATLSMDVRCVSCSSPGVELLPDLLRILDEEGSFRVLLGQIQSFAAEILLADDLVQTQVDRWLIEAPKSCPHSDQYDENAAPSDFAPLRFPALSKEAVESVIYTGTLAAELGLVVFAESHLSYNMSSGDFLSGQNALEVPEGTRLLDLSSVGERIGSWIDTAIDELNAYLSGLVEDVGGPNGDEDLGINVIARRLLLDENRVLSIDFDNLSFIAGETNEMRIELQRLRILGLDTFTTFDALDIVANQTIRNLFGWNELEMKVDVIIQTPEDTGTLTISLGVDQVDVAVSLLLAIDLDRIGALEFGSLLWVDQILPCFLSSASALELTELAVSVGDVKGPTFEGFLSDYMASAIANVTTAIFDDGNYRETLIAAVPGAFDVTVRTTLNNWMNYYLSQESSVSCPKFETARQLQNEIRFVDFRDMLVKPDESIELGGLGGEQYGDLISSVRDILLGQVLKVDPASGKSALNDFLISPFTKSQSGVAGTLVYEGDLLDVGTYVDIGGLQANIKLGVFDARVENLDTVGEPLSVLDPIFMKPHELNNTGGFGVGSDPLRLAARVLIAIQGKDDDMQIRNEVDVSVDMFSASVVLGILLKIAESPLVSFPLKDAANINCWLATIPAPELDSSGVRQEGEDASAALHKLALAVARVGLNVTCISCSGPTMVELTELLSSPDSAEDISRSVNNLIGFATDFLGGGFVQLQLDRLLSDAPKKCPHHEDYDASYAGAAYEPFPVERSSDDSLQFLLTLLVIAACIIAALLVVAWVVRLIVRRRHAKWLRSLPGQSVFILYREQKFQAEKEAELNRATKSMFLSEAIPSYVRWLIPVVIIGNIALFLSGHLSLGATVNIQAELAGQRFTVDKFFEFSMARSIFDIWEAGGKELAIMLIIFSGVWPYTKQFITLALWFCPPTRVSVSRRGSILLWLDVLAKWSMVDIFTLVVTIAAFRVTIESPDVSFLPEDFYSISLLVVPLWGLYANMIAQLVSQVSSHYIIHYHRRIVIVAQEEHNQSLAPSTTEITEGSDVDCQGSTSENQLSPSDLPRERLCNHSYSRPHRGQSDKLRTRRSVNPLVIGGAICMTVLIVVGCVLPTFAVEILGILGVAVESGQDFEQARTEYNIFSIVGVLMDQAKFLGGFGDYIGLGTLSILLICTVLLVPLAQSALLLRQWLVPMNARMHRRTEILIEILAAWQYVEVYLLSAIVASWQLGPVSEFMLNAYCDSLSATFASLVFFGILDPADAQCFRVQAEVEEGSFVLITGAVLLALLNTFVNKAWFQYQRDTSASTILQDDPKLAAGPDNVDGENFHATISSIHPAPVLFTDTFRWLLLREDGCLFSQRTLDLSLSSLVSRGGQVDDGSDQSPLGVTSGFPESPSVSFSPEIGRHSPTSRSVYVESETSSSISNKNGNILNLSMSGDSLNVDDISCSESIMDIESNAGDMNDEPVMRPALGVALGIPVESSPEKNIIFQSSDTDDDDLVSNASTNAW